MRIRKSAGIFGAYFCFVRLTPIRLSIHDLTRRSTKLFSQRAYPLPFQFTTSQGGRLSGKMYCEHRKDLSIHDLTRRSTQTENSYLAGKTFQFTTSQGGRPYKSNAYGAYISLSIHDLTRRSTRPGVINLIKTATFNSRPHKEVDKNPETTPTLETTFQFTTSQGGRPVTFGIAPRISLSIHDLTRRSTPTSRAMSEYCAFQFTTSQGGRRFTPTISFIFKTFQFTTSQGGRLEQIRHSIR